MMKLTVCFGDSKVVVPCGDGVLTIRELALNALRRARHTFPKLDVRDRIVVHNVSIARDGGILDWDDLVRDVLDDRELVTAHYSIATLADNPVCAEVDRSNLPRNDQLFRHLCTPLVIDLCSDSGTSATSAHSVVQSNEASGSGESAASGGGDGSCLADCPPASHSSHRCLHSLRVAVGDEGNHSSGSSLSLNMSTGSFSGATQGMNARTWRLVDTIGQTTTKSDFSIEQPRISQSNSLNPHSGMNEIARLYQAPSQKNIQGGCESSTAVSAVVDRQKTSSSDHHSWLHSANHAKSPIWHQVFSPTTLETITATLCRRRDCIDMNWDTDEEEEEEEEEEEKEDENRTSAFIGCGELPATLLYGELCQDIQLTARSECTDNTISNRWNRHQATQTAFPSLSDSIDVQLPETIPYVCLPIANTNPSCPIFVPTSSMSLAHNTWPLPPPPVSHPEDIISTTTNSNYASVDRVCVDVPPHSCSQSTSVDGKQSVFSLRITSCDDTVSSVGPPISTNNTPITLTVDELKASTDLESPVLSPLSTFGQHDLFDSLLHREPLSSVFSMPQSTKLTVMNRPLFCGLTVPPIMEEEEEVSVDYDQSLLTTSLQQTTLDRSSPSAVHTVLMTPVEPIEEDYPLLRPDYTVSQERMEQESSETTVYGNSVVNSGSATNRTDLNSPSFQPALSDGPVSGHRPKRGLSVPAVLSWLESTEAANAMDPLRVTVTSDNGSSSTISGLSIPVGQESADEERCPTQRSLVESKRSLEQILPGTVRVRLVNTKRGENLGIQIKPVFISPINLSREGSVQSSTENRIESGLEVHHVMPDGRVAREGCLSVGDRILRINNVSLTGVPFEKSRDIFQKALSQPELVLDVFPCSTRRKMQEALEASSEKLPFMTSRLVVIKDQDAKAKEAEAGAIHSSGKPAPPPPPRRSPSTVLSRPSISPDNASSEENQSHTTTLVVTSCVGLSTTANAASSLNCLNLSAEGYIPIYLQKGTNGLGFSLSSREDPANNGERIVCVKSILPGGAALMDGRLKPGDRLVQVDDFDVAILGQTRTVTLLREKPTNSLVKLLVWRSPRTSIDNATGNHTQVALLASDAVAAQSQIAPPSSIDAKVNDLELYRKHLIDPSCHDIFELYIQLPSITPDLAVPLVSPAAEVSSVSSSTYPVTLGVSVSVRPMLPRAKSQTTTIPHEYLDNAVFVRTLIEGGPAHRDGRLQVGDRLLSIDDEPLSAISSLDALGRLKSVIARDLSEKRPHVRLLISRSRLCEEPDASQSIGSRAAHSKPSANFSTRSNTTAKPVPVREHGSEPPPVPVKTSMTVAAEVHVMGGACASSQSTLFEPSRSLSTTTRMSSKMSSGSGHNRAHSLHNTSTTAAAASPAQKHPSTNSQRSSRPSRRDGHHKSKKQSPPSHHSHHHHHMVKRHNHHSSHPHLAQSGRGPEHKSGSIKSSSGHDLSSILPPVNQVAVESALAVSPTPDSSPPTIRSPSCIPNEPTPTCPIVSQPSDVERYDRVYRCDSQGTISSTEMPECDGHQPTQLICHIPSKSDCSLNDSVAFSDSELEYHAPHSSIRRLTRATTSRPQLRQGSTMRRPPTNELHHNWDSKNPPCRVVIRQPRIDLSQLVLVPFDPDSWTGPVLKHTSALKPAELAMLTMRKTINTQGSKRISSGLSTLSPHVTKYGSPNIRDTNVPNNWKVPASYDSDSGTSRKDSLSSGTEPSERTSHKRLLNKIFHLVKTGTQRRPVRADSSTGTQTELLVDQKSFTEYHSVPRNPAPPRQRLRVDTQSHSATQTDDADQQFHLVPTVTESGSIMSSHWRGYPPNVPVHCRNSSCVPSSSESSAAYSALHCNSVAIKHAYSVANTDESSSHVQFTTGLARFSTDCPLDSNVHRTAPPSRWSASEPHDRQRFYAYADLSFDDFLTEAHTEQVTVPTDHDVSVCSEASLEPNTQMLELRVNQSSINRLFDTDASSCSTAYESVVEFMQTIEQELIPKEKSSREVYEDAEALYRYLAEIKERPIQETEDKETDEESTKISGTSSCEHK